MAKYCMYYLKNTIFRRWNEAGVQITKSMNTHFLNCHFPNPPIASTICSFKSSFVLSSLLLHESFFEIFPLSSSISVNEKNNIYYFYFTCQFICKTQYQYSHWTQIFLSFQMQVNIFRFDNDWSKNLLCLY